jgi:hypothetical protein
MTDSVFANKIVVISLFAAFRESVRKWNAFRIGQSIEANVFVCRVIRASLSTSLLYVFIYSAWVEPMQTWHISMVMICRKCILRGGIAIYMWSFLQRRWHAFLRGGILSG